MSQHPPPFHTSNNMKNSTNDCCYHVSRILGRRAIALVVMISLVTGFSVRGRLFNKWGRLQSLYASSQAAAVIPTVHPSYQKLEDFQIKEYGFNGSIYSHKKSGAQVRAESSGSE